MSAGGAPWDNAGEVTRLRVAVQRIQDALAGDRYPRWDTPEAVTATRSWLLDITNAALAAAPKLPDDLEVCASCAGQGGIGAPQIGVIPIIGWRLCDRCHGKGKVPRLVLPAVCVLLPTEAKALLAVVDEMTYLKKFAPLDVRYTHVKACLEALPPETRAKLERAAREA